VIQAGGSGNHGEILSEPPGETNRPGDADDVEQSALARVGAMAHRGVLASHAWTERFWAWTERKRDTNVVVDLGLRLHTRDQEAAGTVAGSAVAFRLFLFFVPTLLVFVALAGFLAGHISSEDASSTVGVTGAIAKQIDTAMRQPASTRWTALLVGLVGMATSGWSLARAMVLTSSLSWRTPNIRKATVRVTAIVVGIMLAVAVFASIANRIRIDRGPALAGASFVGTVAAYFLAWMALSLTLPRSTKDPGVVIPGAVLLGVTLAGLQAVTQFYVPNQIDHASALYGTIGIVIVTLGWLFFVGRLAVFSATLNAVVFEEFGSITMFVFGLPLLRAIPARSPRLAHFFGLDSDEAPVDRDLGGSAEAHPSD
jgi:membrane protein